MNKIIITQKDFMNSKIPTSNKALVIPKYSSYYHAFLIDINSPPSKLTYLINSQDYTTLTDMLISLPHWFDRFWLRYLALTIKHKLGRQAEYPYMKSLKLDRKDLILQEVTNIKHIYRIACLNEISNKKNAGISNCRNQIIRELQLNRRAIHKMIKAQRLAEIKRAKENKIFEIKRLKEEIKLAKNKIKREKLMKTGKLWVQFNVNKWIKKRGQYYHDGYQTIVGILEKENPKSILVKVNGEESQLFKSYVEYKELLNYRVKRN